LIRANYFKDFFSEPANFNSYSIRTSPSEIFFLGIIWKYKTINRNIAIQMGATKTDLFTKQQNELASMAKAIAHPARIAILQYLVKKNACVCGDIVDELGLAQATTSQHLKELKNAGIIQGNIEGVSVCYCIEPKVWKQYKELFSGFFKEVDLSGKCC
jgi:DNA-binding transcriptional ArsR family regulator